MQNSNILLFVDENSISWHSKIYLQVSRTFLTFKKNHFAGKVLSPPPHVNGIGRGQRRWNAAQVGWGGSDMYPDYVAVAEISTDLANFEAKNLKAKNLQNF